MGDLTDNDPSYRRHRAARSGRRADVVPTAASVDDLVAALRDADQEPATPTKRAAREESGSDGVTDDGAVRLAEDLPMDPDDDLLSVPDGEVSAELVSIVESLLFAATAPLRVKDMRKILQEPSTGQVQQALKEVQRRCVDRGWVLQQVAGGFRFSTRPDNAHWVQRMLASKPARLSRSQLEALAVIAYRQPITKAEIDHIRGVDCGAVLRVLLERDLVQIVGRKEEPGRPHLYGTTVAFLEFFNLRGLRDLPALHEFRELTEDSREALRKRWGDSEELEVMGQSRLEFLRGEAEGDAVPLESAEDPFDDGSALDGDESGQDPFDDGAALDGEASAADDPGAREDESTDPDETP